MAERIFDRNDNSEDIVMRLSSDEAHALYSLLSKMNQGELLSKGLATEQCEAIRRVLHTTY